MTTDWLTSVRRDLHDWDRLVEQKWIHPWQWSHAEYLRDPGLRYGSPPTKLSTRLGFRQRRGSTGELGRGHKPPSAMHSFETSRPLSIMKMRLPAYIWAMLVRGLEAESEEVEQVVGNGHEVAGIGLIQRWREYDGERFWPHGTSSHNRSMSGDISEQFFVQRMRWERKDGRWCGRWAWEEYKRDFDWKMWYYLGETGPLPSSLLSDYPPLTGSAVESGAGGTMPQEVLLGVVRELEGSNWATVASIGSTCRAWLNICAPQLYSRIHVRATDIDEFIEYLSQPRSHIPRFAQDLCIRGYIPWLALPRLFKLLSHVEAVAIEESLEDGRPWDVPQVYHPNDSHFAATLQHTSRYLTGITTLYLLREYFASSLDLLRLLGSFPYLATATLASCQVAIRLAITPAVTATHLNWIRADPYLLRSMVHCWEWPHPPGSSSAAFPGIHHRDACGMTTLFQCVRFEGDILMLDLSWHTDSWVLTACSTLPEHRIPRRIDIEFHVARDSSATTNTHGALARAAKLRVRHVVFRVHADEGEPMFWHGVDGSEILKRMDATLVNSFTRLVSVTIESTAGVQDSTIVQLASHMKLMRARGMLLQRTCGDAEKLAQEALRDGRGSGADSREIVSPLWYAERHSEQRSLWLSLVEQRDLDSRRLRLEPPKHDDATSIPVKEYEAGGNASIASSQ